MKSRLTFYPFLRREFADLEELSTVINRSVRYAQDRINGKREFTSREKNLIADYLKATEEQRQLLFIREVNK